MIDPGLVLVGMMLFHWIGDFILQSNEMATNKSKSIYYLSSHVFVYSVTIYLYLMLLLLMGFEITVLDCYWFFGFNFSAHWLIDFITSRITSTLYRKNRIHDFFVVIGFDQLLHFTTLYISLRYLNLI